MCGNIHDPVDVGAWCAVLYCCVLLTSASERHGNDQDLEKPFLQDLRELKYVMSSALDEHRGYCRGSTVSLLTLCVSQIQGILPADEFRICDPVFKPVSRSLLAIGAGLSHTKELRDIFEDIQGKVRSSGRL